MTQADRLERLIKEFERVGVDPNTISAGLAVRENDFKTADTAILKAMTLAPNDAEILFEAGHIAQLGGDEAKARGLWQRAMAASPGGPGGAAAKKALELLDQPAPNATR